VPSCVPMSLKRADIGVLERGNGFGLALHALLQFRIIGEMCRQTLMATVRSRRVSLARSDLTHATSAEGREDFVGTSFCARGKGHAACRQL